MLALFCERYCNYKYNYCCILAFATCGEDPLIGTGIFDVDTLVLRNKRVELNNVNPICVGLRKTCCS